MSGAAGDHRQELERQRQILRQEMPERIVFTTLCLGLCAMFTSPWLLAGFCALNLLLEVIGLKTMRPAFILKSAGNYAVSLGQSVLVEATFVAGVGLVWLSDNPFSKAFATGATVMTLMHLATVRSIHLAAGVAGLVGAAATVAIFNATYWIPRGDFVGLAISSAAIFGAIGYTLTAMLSNHRLHRSMAAQESSARTAHAAKSLFLAQMSHELRTPLNAIIGMGHVELSAALNEKADAPRIERLNLLVNSARSLATILDDVTDLNAAGEARLHLRERTIDFRAELDGLVSAFKAQAERSGVGLTTEVCPTCPRQLSLDTVRLRQCLGNLLSNALRHAPDGPIHASCKGMPDPDGLGGTLVIDVSDTGPGVPEDQREAIFQPFHKGRMAAPGTGLGLAISKELARLMGGDLVLVPSEKGAHFRLEVRYGPPTTPLVDAGPPDLDRRRILVVDDIASNRLVAATYLKSWGAKVIEAANGDAALQILAAEELDLMLLDMNMPGMDGYEVTRRTRMMGGRMAQLPIVALTADVMDEDVRAFRRAGADGHLPKPLLPETLAAELRRLLP